MGDFCLVELSISPFNLTVGCTSLDQRYYCGTVGLELGFHEALVNLKEVVDLPSVTEHI